MSKKEGGPPKYKPAPEIDLDDVGDSAEGKKGGEISGPKGSVRLKTAKFKKKIGFSKAEEDEQYGVFSVEVKAGKDGPLDLEAFYEDGCDDFFTEWMCDEGGHAGSVYACDRPHWGDKFETGLVASGRKAAFNCCYTFEKPSKDCTTTVDGRVFGLGDVEISF